MILLKALLDVVDLVRRQQRAEAEDARGEHLSRLPVEHALRVHQQHAHRATIDVGIWDDKGLAPHPDALRIPLAPAAVAETLVLHFLRRQRAALQSIASIGDPLRNLPRRSEFNLVALYSLRRI